MVIAIVLFLYELRSSCKLQNTRMMYEHKYKKIINSELTKDIRCRRMYSIKNLLIASNFFDTWLDFKTNVTSQRLLFRFMITNKNKKNEVNDWLYFIMEAENKTRVHFLAYGFHCTYGIREKCRRSEGVAKFIAHSSVKYII